MESTILTILCLILLATATILAFIYWARTSSSPVAVALRARFKKEESDLADDLADVEAYETSGLLKHGDLVSLTKMGLHKVRMILEERKLVAKEWQAKFDQAQTDKDFADEHDNFPAFKAASRALDQAKKMLAIAMAARDQIQDVVNAMEGDLDANRDEHMELEADSAQRIANAVVDQVRVQNGELKAGLTEKDAGQSDFDHAKKLAVKLRARANAATVASNGMTPLEREDYALQQLRESVGKTDAAAEWAQRKAKKATS